jgi:hypothetical protein
LNPQVTVALAGAIAHESDTAEVKLLNEVTVIVVAVVFPAVVVAEAGPEPRVKLFTVNA